MKKKILIVEDNVSLRDILKWSLEKDFAVLQTGDGEEALSFCDKEKPSLILMDVMLPKVDAGILCSKIRSFPKFGNPKIIIMTGMSSKSNDFKDRWKSMYQVDDFFFKPFEMPVVIRRIKELLDV